MFLARGLQKILAEREIKKSNYAPLKKACDDALGAYERAEWNKV